MTLAEKSILHETPPSRFVSGYWLERVSLEVWHSSSIVLKIGSTRKRYVEEAHFKRILWPYDHFQGPIQVPATEQKSKRFKASMALQCTYDPSVVRLIPNDISRLAVQLKEEEYDEETDA